MTIRAAHTWEIITMTVRTIHQGLLSAAVAAFAFATLAGPAVAEDKKEEVPFWAIGRPES